MGLSGEGCHPNLDVVLDQTRRMETPLDHGSLALRSDESFLHRSGALVPKSKRP